MTILLKIKEYSGLVSMQSVSGMRVFILTGTLIYSSTERASTTSGSLKICKLVTQFLLKVTLSFT